MGIVRIPGVVRKTLVLPAVPRKGIPVDIATVVIAKYLAMEL